MTKTIKKDYSINHSVLVTYNTLDALYKKFSNVYPDEIILKI